MTAPSLPSGNAGNAPEMRPRDYLCALEIDFDIDAQLRAIRGLLRRNRIEGESSENEAQRIESAAKGLAGDASQRAADEWVEHIHDSVYQDAAHSMSAVGMLAPFMETFFRQSFLRIGERYFSQTSPPTAHARWQGASDFWWDCAYFLRPTNKQKGIVGGIMQLSEAVALSTSLPPDLERTLSALFGYRNNMFHWGFEWPQTERAKFARRILADGWPPGWFSAAESDGLPWIHYMTDAFIEHCLDTFDHVLDAVGAFVAMREAAKWQLPS